LSQVKAEVIKHSVFPSGSELITLEIELHRFILPEFNTHSSNSKNFQSTRAVPILKQLELIAQNGIAYPVEYYKKSKGMSGRELLSQEDVEKCENIIEEMAKFCCDKVKELDKIGLHKQTAGRYIEPYMYTKGVVTATKKAFDWFFNLREDVEAQPEIKALAKCMKTAIEASKPIVRTSANAWHLPYVEEESALSLSDKLKVSVSCCAQVSYRKLDDSLDKARDIVDNKLSGKEGKPHHSPFQHQATSCDLLSIFGANSYKSNFNNFGEEDIIQYRKLIEAGSL